MKQYRLSLKGGELSICVRRKFPRSSRVDPGKYLPQYGGYCAYAMSLNRIAAIDPSRWAIVDGKLYLNNGFVAEKLPVA